MTPPHVPYGQLHQLRQQVNRLVDLLLERPMTPGTQWHPPTDVVDRGDRVEVEVEVPGLTADQLLVELTDQRLTIRGAKQRLRNEPPPRRFHLMERFIGSFEVSVELQHPVHPKQAAARLQDGLLRIVLPKLEDKRHRSFRIQIAEEDSNDE